MTVEEGKVIHQEIFNVTHQNLTQRIEQLAARGVDKVICGGIDEFSLNQLKNRGMEVLHNVAGEAKTATDLFLKGKLHSGFCCDSRRPRGFCGWRKGLGGRRL